MIKLEQVLTPSPEIWLTVIRGMRNAKNSWHLSDSEYISPRGGVPAPCVFRIGPNDHKLMMSLSKGGSDDRKFMRMIVVYLDIIAPLYWWKEFDTYKVGTVANSCSTMHKIHDKEFTLEDFSTEHLADCELVGIDGCPDGLTPKMLMQMIVDMLNYYRNGFNEDGKNKDDWWNMIQLLSTSYNQKRTIMLNYEVLKNMYHARKNHKLDEWRDFCKWIESLPYSELITGGKKE